jgi:hypothetical protein
MFNSIISYFLILVAWTIRRKYENKLYIWRSCHQTWKRL